jgi:hypothetical protein
VEVSGDFETSAECKVNLSGTVRMIVKDHLPEYFTVETFSLVAISKETNSYTSIGDLISTDDLMSKSTNEVNLIEKHLNYLSTESNRGIFDNISDWLVENVDKNLIN